MSRALTLTEGGDPVTAPLTEGEAAALAGTRLAMPLRTADPNEWQLVPGRRVGTVRIGPGLQITVHPKVNVDRLVFMMGYARNPKFWRDDPVALPRHAELPEALAHTFQRLAASALEQGLLHGYKTVEDSLHVVRGRIRTDDQLRLRFDRPLPVEVRYDEFTADISENQLLLVAVLRLLRAPKVTAAIRAGLHRLRLQLADVQQLPTGTSLPSWQPSRLNARYQPALHLAELIIAATSFEQRGPGPDTDVSGFVLDTWRIFEDFVCVALGEALAAEMPGRGVFQHRDRLDEANHVPIEPDFTWWNGRRPVIVADAKYKQERLDGYPNADAYQLLAYCTALDVRDGHLIYAEGDRRPEVLKVRNSPVRIHWHALDLSREPAGMLDDVDRLARQLMA